MKKLQFIRNHSVHQEDLFKAVKRQQILDYVLDEYVRKCKKPSCADIHEATNMELYTYFKSLSEIYKILRIPPPLRGMHGSRAKTPDNDVIILWKEEFKKFIIDKINNGEKYPTGVEIAKHFGISHIWNVVKVSDLYIELGLKPYLERGKGSRTSTSVQGV